MVRLPSHSLSSFIDSFSRSIRYLHLWHYRGTQGRRCPPSRSYQRYVIIFAASLLRLTSVLTVISGSPANVGMRPGLRVGQFLNIAFDMGAWEILGSLYNGCTLCIRGNTKRDWIAVMKTVHVVIATPSILTLHEPADYPTIQHVIVGGACSSSSCRPRYLYESVIPGEPCPQGTSSLLPIY